MSVTELINKLQKCNPDAKVIITMGSYDTDILSTTDFNIMGYDIEEYVEIFIDNDNCAKQV